MQYREPDPRSADTDRRHDAARRRTLRRDAARPIGENLEEGARLALAATTMAQAFTATSKATSAAPASRRS